MIEKERKFLLKNLPPQIPDQVLDIVQLYMPDGRRFRCSKDIITGIKSYESIFKRKLEKGVNEELDIKVEDVDAYNKALEVAEKFVSKTRRIYHVGKHKFEVDHFHDVKLVVMEVECTDLDEVIHFPDHFKEQILMEVTGIDTFDNINLAIKNHCKI